MILLKNDLAKELYKFYRSGFRKNRGGESSTEVREKIYLVIGRRLLGLKLLNTQRQSH